MGITVRVFDESDMLYESDYLYDGNGFTVTTGTPRGDYYTFRNMNVQLLSGVEYTVVFVIHCPATKTSRAEYPLCAPHYEVYSIDDFGSSIVNGYAYGEEYEIPTESDLYAPFVRICYTPGETKAPIPTEQPSSPPTPAPVDTVSPSDMPTSSLSSTSTITPTDTPTQTPTEIPTAEPSTVTPTQSPAPYECINVELQPCTNITGRDVTFYERSDNQDQVTSDYYWGELDTAQKGYTFIASEDMVMYEAGMAFVNLASYQSITVRVFDDDEMLYESDYSYDGKGFTVTTGTPRGDYYTFRNMNVQLLSGEEYTLVFVVHCPATKTSRAEYPLCAPNHEVYSIDDFGASIVNVYAYGEEYELPTESDLYAPFVRICYTPGTL